LAMGPRSPDRKLISRRCAECIAGRQKNAVAFFFEILRELGNRGRFSRAVHAGDQVNRRSFGSNSKRSRPRVFQEGFELILDQVQEIEVSGFISISLADPAYDSGRSGHSHVRLDQPAFQIVQKRLVDLAVEPGPDIEKLGRFGETLFESIK